MNAKSRSGHASFYVLASDALSQNSDKTNPLRMSMSNRYMYQLNNVKRKVSEIGTEPIVEDMITAQYRL